MNKRIAAGLAAVALAATACGSSEAGAGNVVFHTPKPTTAPTHSLAITFDLFAADVAATGCLTGDTGYVDLGPGTPIVVKDESGKILGTGSLSQPQLLDDTTCEWNEEINDIPTNRQQYGVQIGSRGWIYSSARQIRADNWTISMHLGS